MLNDAVTYEVIARESQKQLKIATSVTSDSPVIKYEVSEVMQGKKKG
jgi:hypothetical protein